MDTSITLLIIFVVVLVIALAIYRYSVNCKETTSAEQKALTDTYFEICPKCGKELTDEEKSNRQCSNCGEVLAIPAEVADQSNTVPDPISNLISSKNTYATILKWSGIATIVIGVIISIALSNIEVQGYHYSHNEFSILAFCLYMVIFCVSGFFLMGVGEIIQILDDIRRK